MPARTALMTPVEYRVLALGNVPLIRPGDDLARVAIGAMKDAALAFEDGDVLVLAQKIVSKAEGRQVSLSSVSPGPQARELAAQTGKDARLVELILSEAQEVVRTRPGLVIVRHRTGLVLANAGIDQSNVGTGSGFDNDEEGRALLLPVDPDESAARISQDIFAQTGRRIAVLVIDSLGRAWRMGTTGTAIGVAGMSALLDLRGKPDLNGRMLESSEVGLADEIAAAASLAMGQADEGRPMVLVRGLPATPDGGKAVDLVRPRQQDLFP